MLENETGPKLKIRSKLDLAKHISHKKFSIEEASALITDVLKNHERYWKDNINKSKPLEEKWVRNAKRTPLGILLGKIDKMVLAPHDKFIPQFIFGGLQNKNHVEAVLHLEATGGKRTLLKIDLRRFFEQISQERVISFLINKCGCSYKGAALIAKLCCVPLGKKGSLSPKSTIARGFATSPRLATWCSLDLFLKAESLIKKNLAGKDPKIAIFVDDLGITARKVKKVEMLKIAEEIKFLFENYKRPLIINTKKQKVVAHNEGMEHLGLGIKKGRLVLGAKTLSRRSRLKNALKAKISPLESRKIKRSLRGISQHQAYINKANTSRT